MSIVFSIDNFLLGFTPIDIFVTIVAAMLLSIAYVQKRHLNISVLYDTVLVGSCFFGFQLVERWAQDTPRWERSAANLALWGIFMVSIWIFSFIRGRKY